MKITVFEKQRKAKNGNAFKVYVTNLIKKDGSKLYVTVRFKDGVKKPTEFPVIINVPKEKANLSEREFTRSDGGTGVNYTLWVNGYEETGEKYVDHSLDDFE